MNLHGVGNWVMTRMCDALRSLLVIFVMLLFLSAGSGCGKSSDAIVSIALHPTNSKILYVATNESVYKTRDGGGTWERMATDLSTYRVLSIAIDPERPVLDVDAVHSDVDELHDQQLLLAQPLGVEPA